jgi:dTDP-4-amino-4,6-dideoxygalactose transaminase
MGILNYGSQFIDKDDILSVESSLTQNYLTTGPIVKKFEDKIKKNLNCKFVASCSSGTAAINLAFKAINLKKNDIVILPIINFISSTNILTQLNAKVFYSDVDPLTGQMTPDLLNQCIKKNKLKNIKAFVTMYLGGCCNYNYDFFKLKKKLNCYMIEDACHALGADYKIKNRYYKIGSCKHADVSTFSLHPVKSITTGEGGIVTTNKKEIFNKIISYRSHGIKRNKDKHWDYDIVNSGYNFRLSDINCSLGLSQLKKLNKFIKKRRLIARQYNSLLKNLDYISIPKINKNINSSWHLYILLIDFKKLKKKKVDLFNYFKKRNIRLQQHYIPTNKYSLYKTKIPGKFQNSLSYFNKTVSLPIHYNCTNKDIVSIVNKLKKFLKLN